MEYKHSFYNLYRIGGSLFIFGLSMLIFPTVYAHSDNYHFEYPDNIYTGIILMAVGAFLVLVKYFSEKKGKK
jgi:hypothetical protein